MNGRAFGFSNIQTENTQTHDSNSNNCYNKYHNYYYNYDYINCYYKKPSNQTKHKHATALWLMVRWMGGLVDGSVCAWVDG